MKVAVFTPLNPARSGIADYSEALLPHLAKRLDVEVFIDDYEPAGVPGGEGIPIRNYREFQPDQFDATLYHLGNNPYHIYIYQQARRSPGIVMMHEFNMHHLVADATIKGGDWEQYLRELEYDAGPEALSRGRRVQAGDIGPDYDGVPLNRRILESAQALIVHSRFLVNEIQRKKVSAPLCVIPHGASIPEVNRPRYRNLLGAGPDTPLIGIFGFLKPYKRIAECLAALRRLVRLDPRVKMILVGEEHPDFPVRQLVKRMELEGHVRILGYVPLSEFVQYLGAVDICLNLRYPTAGETSGTLLRALGLGRAVFVSDVGAFSDLPNDICLKVPVGAEEVDLITEYLHLLTLRPESAQALGQRARDWVARECSWESAAERYTAWIEAVAAGDRQQIAELAAASVCRPETAEPAVQEKGVAASAAPPRERHRSLPSPPAQEALSSSEPPVRRENEDEDENRSRWKEYIRGYCFDRPHDAQYVETHLDRLVRTLELTPPAKPGERILEMGAYMHITPALKHRLGYEEVRGCYLGPVGKVDYREVRSATGEEFACEIDLFDAEKDDYPYPEDSFAVVLCCELIEHLYDDPMHLMAEVNRILQPGGRLVLTTPNACSLRAIAAILLRYHPGLFHHYVIPDERGSRDPRHAREYAPRDVQALLEAAGFEVKTLETGPYLARQSHELDWVQHLLKRYDLPMDLREDSIFAVGHKVGPIRERYPAALYAGGAG